MKLCGCVIWYNPTEKDKVNIETYLNGVDKLFIIDNSTEENYKKKYDNVEYIPLLKNIGIAAALNIACQKALTEEYEWILTMDQDSNFNKNFIDYKKSCKKKINEDDTIALFAPSINLDKNYGYVKKVITSGNILNLKVWKEIGGFANDFFIDEVDFEICARINLKGYKIYRFEYIKLNHSLGETFSINIFGVKTYCMNHSYIRKYYITRNRLFMRKMYPELTKKYLFHIILDFYKVIFYEKQKLKKIKYMLYGIRDYKLNRKGKFECLHG